MTKEADVLSIDNRQVRAQWSQGPFDNFPAPAVNEHALTGWMWANRTVAYPGEGISAGINPLEAERRIERKGEEKKKKRKRKSKEKKSERGVSLRAWLSACVKYGASDASEISNRIYPLYE